MNKPKLLQGTISISRWQGGDESQPIHIELIDELSLVRVVDIRMSLEAFASAITGMGYQKCQFEHRPERVGMKREHKTEVVPCGSTVGLTPEAADALLLPFEIDGWKGRPEDLRNSHNRAPGGQRVTFIRYVEAQP